MQSSRILGYPKSRTIAISSLSCFMDISPSSTRGSYNQTLMIKVLNTDTKIEISKSKIKHHKYGLCICFNWAILSFCESLLSWSNSLMPIWTFSLKTETAVWWFLERREGEWVKDALRFNFEKGTSSRHGIKMNYTICIHYIFPSCRYAGDDMNFWAGTFKTSVRHYSLYNTILLFNLAESQCSSLPTLPNQQENAQTHAYVYIWKWWI